MSDAEDGADRDERRRCTAGPTSGECLRERRLLSISRVVDHAGQHQAGEHVEHHRDRQRVAGSPWACASARPWTPRPRCSSRRSRTPRRTPSRRRRTRRSSPNGRNGCSCRRHVEHADHDDQQHDRDLEQDQEGLERGRRCAYPGSGRTRSAGRAAARTGRPRRSRGCLRARCPARRASTRAAATPRSRAGRRSSRRCRWPTTATIAVYSSSRSQPMNQPTNSPSTT